MIPAEIWMWLFKEIKLKVWYIFIPILLLLAIFLQRGCKRPELIRNDPNIMKPVENKVDKKGTPYVEIKEQMYTKAQVKEITDSFRRNFKGKPQIKEVIRYVAYVDTSLKTEGPKIDTFEGNVTISDSFQSKDVYISYKGSSLTKTGTFNLSLTPDTTTFLVAEKKKLFKANERTINIYHTNSLIKTAVGTAYTEKIPKPILTLIAGGYYDPILNKYGFCISAGVPLITIKNNK